MLIYLSKGKLISNCWSVDLILFFPFQEKLTALYFQQIQGFPAKIDSKKDLMDIVARIISQVTVQHAAVNYELADYAVYAPNLPTKLYNDTRVKDGEFSVYRLPNRLTSAVSNVCIF